MIVVPPDFAAAVMTRDAEAGRRWLADLPDLVAALCAQWSLMIEGLPRHGHLGLVIPTRRGDEPCVLKVSSIPAETEHEAAALATWAGQGAVRLLAVQPACGALLLERADSHRTLHSVEVAAASVIAGRLLRRLAVLAPASLPRLTDTAAHLATHLTARWERLGHPFPPRLLAAARTLSLQLGPTAGDRLVNYDLHYGNVLAAAREPWLAIDPKVVGGDPEYGLAQLLWTRLDEIGGSAGLRRQFQALIEAAALDPPRARAWTLIRVVDYWLWGVSIGLTSDPARCEAITTWLVLDR